MSLPRPLLLLLALTTACTSTTVPLDIGGVEVRAANGELLIHNATRSPVFTFAVGREAASVVDWIPCAEPRCDPLPAGGERRIPLSQIVGGAEPELNFYWWHGVATPNGWKPDSIRNAIVKTR